MSGDESELRDDQDDDDDHLLNRVAADQDEWIRANFGDEAAAFHELRMGNGYPGA